MTDMNMTPSKPDEKPQRVAMPFKEFLESVHPSRAEQITDLSYRHQYSSGSSEMRVNTPDLRLHCTNEHCNGVRTFRAIQTEPTFREEIRDAILVYRCGDCEDMEKRFSLLLKRDSKSAGVGGMAYKYGENPPYGVPVPNKLLRLFGKDGETFLKGRQCENQGLGVGAFAYYRRVVENHRNDIFDAIVKVCETVGADQNLIDELSSAKNEVSFTKSMDKIKTALPQGLLINGQNPLLALHGALSTGIHVETDEQCLAIAQAVRVVLTDLVDKMSSLRQEDQQLKQAVQLLIAKRG